MKGTITKLGNGFGYIKSSGPQPEVFFHVSVLVGCEFKDVKPGDQVEFEVNEKSPALGATLVRKLNL